MRVTIAAIGKMKSCPEQKIMANYFKRLPWSVQIKEMEAKNGLKGKKLIEAEGKLLLKSVEKSSKRIVLDERGKRFSSQDFARKLESFEIDGDSNIAFLIGGADGHSDEVKQNSDLTISLSEMTWPHMMVRAMLSEQLYRAYTITQGHPYHRQ